MSDDVVADVRRIFDDLDEVAERVESARSAASLRPMGTRAREDAADRERGRILADGVSGLAKVRAGREVDDAERIGLRAIVQQEGRPAIVVRDGDFGEPPALWSQLSGRRERIREVIARAGRVEVDGHPDHAWVGTAWLVAPATLMTNRHVASKFCRRRRRSWTFRPGMQSRIDFVREQDSTGSLQFEITEAIGVHDDHDLALLRIEGASRDGRPLPDPLAVAASAPRELLGREVYLVGYPMSDPDRNEPEAIQRIFRDVFDVKRLQPGRTIGYSTELSALEHDCSTLGGNSGSPLVDLETNLVIGLHFGGTYEVGNYAVPLWMLVDDPLLKAGGIDFR